MEIREYKYKHGTIFIKIVPYETKFKCSINWNYKKNTKNDEPDELSESNTYYKIIQKEIKNCISSLNKIKNKGISTKQLITNLLDLHQKISEEQYKQIKIF